MSIYQEKQRIENGLASVRASIAAKGVAVPAGTRIDGLSPLIDAIHAGTQLASVTVTAPPTRLQYQQGEAFDPSGMVVTAGYSDGSAYVLADYSVTPAVFETGEEQAVTVSYSERGTSRTASVPVTVIPGISARELAVGSSVYLKVDGEAREFLIVQQGNPASTVYDVSCDGVWLLMKDCYENRRWHTSTVNDYENSDIHRYLNNDFLNRLDGSLLEVVKEVKIPYRPGSGYDKTVSSGANGLSAKAFLLSYEELSFGHPYMPTGEGFELEYFKGLSNTGKVDKRVAYLDGTAVYWHLRSPYCAEAQGAGWSGLSSQNGSYSAINSSASYGIRPAMILPSGTVFKRDTLEFLMGP